MRLGLLRMLCGAAAMSATAAQAQDFPNKPVTKAANVKVD